MTFTRVPTIADYTVEVTKGQCVFMNMKTFIAIIDSCIASLTLSCSKHSTKAALSMRLCTGGSWKLHCI